MILTASNVDATETTESVKSKTAYIEVLGLVYLGLACIGYFPRVLIDDWVIEWLCWFSALVSILLLLWGIRAYFRPNSQMRQRVIAKKSSGLKLLLLAMVYIPMLTFMALPRGLPVVLHLLLPSTPASEQVTVVKRVDGRLCYAGVQVKEFTAWGNDVCGVSWIDWRHLEAGQQLQLQGKRTLIGFSYRNYHIVR